MKASTTNNRQLASSSSRSTGTGKLCSGIFQTCLFGVFSCAAFCAAFCFVLSTAGCRHVPVYHEPQGYSSSYDRAVQAADPLGEDFPIIRPTAVERRLLRKQSLPMQQQPPVEQNFIEQPFTEQRF